MNAAVLRTAWQAGTPPVGRVVEVWYLVAIIPAVWTGSEWRTADGDRIDGVTRWRYRQ